MLTMQKRLLNLLLLLLLVAAAVANDAQSWVTPLVKQLTKVLAAAMCTGLL